MKTAKPKPTAATSGNGEAQPLNLVDELIQESGGNSEEAEYTFEATSGRTFRARRLRSAGELAKVIARSRRLLTRTDKNTPAAWHPYLPISNEVAIGTSFIEAGLIEPKLSTLDCLRLAEKSGAYFLEISRNLQAEAYNVQAERDEADVEDFLDGSSETE